MFGYVKHKDVKARVEQAQEESFRQHCETLYKQYMLLRAKASLAIERKDLPVLAGYITSLWGYWWGQHPQDVETMNRVVQFVERSSRNPELSYMVRELNTIDSLFSRYSPELLRRK